MSKTLIVAEKPSVGRDIARVLGATQRGEGCIQGKEHVISWAIGHLVSLCEPQEIDQRYAKWRMEDLPILPGQIKTKVLPQTRKQYQILHGWMHSPEIGRIICATDSGREGELIFRYIYAQSKCKKPVMRLWISSMTDEAILAGLSSLRPMSEYDSLYQSARCRSEADWLVGMNASRAFTLRYGVLLSVGRVQTPTLNLLVRRAREIEQFVPQTYYEVVADFGDYTGKWINPDRASIIKTDRESASSKDEKPRSAGAVLHTTDHAKALSVADAVRHRQASVSLLTQTPKKMPPPQLYDLTTLQRDMNRRYHFSAAKTLEIAQSLYEKHKLITYPRTDSRHLSKDMASPVQKTLAALPPPYAQLAQMVKDNPPRPARVYNDAKVTDHHAIIPTPKTAKIQSLTREEQCAYDMIARRFLAVHYPDYEYLSVRVVTCVSGHDFESRGTVPIRQGWREVYQEDSQKSSGEEDVQTLPALAKGDVRTVMGADVLEKQTKPPSPHNDASLLSAMERADTAPDEAPDEEDAKAEMAAQGLGTPATRASIIERLIEVGYVARQGKNLLPTEKGRALIAAAPEEITSPQTTGVWERALYNIAYPKTQSHLQLPQRFMEGICKYATFLVEAAQNAPKEIAFPPEEKKQGKKRGAKGGLVPGAACPLCKEGGVLENSKAFGCTRWKEGCPFTLWKNGLSPLGISKPMTAAQAKKLILGKTLSFPEGTAAWEQGRLILKKANQS